MENKYYKVTQTDAKTYEQEISNRVDDLNEFFLGRDFDDYFYEVQKLSDEEFEETEQ